MRRGSRLTQLWRKVCEVARPSPRKPGEVSPDHRAKSGGLRMLQVAFGAPVDRHVENDPPRR